MQRSQLPALVVGAALFIAACGDGQVTDPPLDVALGETAFVVLVNPVVNTGNGVTLPEPGTARSGISVAPDLGTAVSTNADGVAVLNPVTPGARTVSLQGSGLSGSAGVSIAERDLHEIALALTANGAAIMADVRYAFGGEVVEITPNTPLDQVNAQLARSNVIVFLRGGTYTGDLEFSGSDVTLFGEGAQGGQVTIDGNVTVAGSNNRIRGARITGELTVPGSNAGISFSRIAGNFSLSGSSAVLLKNSFCGAVTLVGSNPTLLANAGLDPVPAPSSGC
jgi:hypothetical protein